MPGEGGSGRPWTQGCVPMMAEFEKWLARVLLLNSVLTVAVVFGLLGPAHEDGALAGLVLAAVLGCVSAALCLRGRLAGLWGGVLYYGLQVFSYYPHDGGRAFSVKAGTSIGVVWQLHGATLVLNLIAATLLAATALVLYRRRSAAPIRP
jgi:hypothetical protein